ncbi:MAG: hypothetical protein ACP5GH_02640 [Nitrososphaeria archaeon]
MIYDFSKRSIGVIAFTYEFYKTHEMFMKYSTRVRKIVDVEGQIFMRTLKPPGPLYYFKLIGGRSRSSC